MKNIIYLFLLIGLLLIAGSCKDPVTGHLGNQPPDTYLSLFPDSIIRPGTTLKKINWWGDDPDGFVVGFKISLDSINWSNPVNRNDSTFFFTIVGNDSVFKVWVAAVDNEGAVDPTPASNLYPVLNSPPGMRFQAGTELPDTTFPVATFNWIGTDPDGDQTIKYYYWSLNDTLHFKSISGTLNIMTLTADSGLNLNGPNKLFMRAQDNAGAFSPIVTMPDSNKTWFVMKNTSKILLIKDMPQIDLSFADAFFVSAFDTMKYDVLNIKSRNGALIPKIVNPMFIETLKLFRMVLWSAYQGGVNTSNDPNFSLAQQSLPYYLQSGRKLFWTSSFPANYQAQVGNINFAPVDSIKSCIIRFILESDSLSVGNNTYPPLTPTQGYYITSTRGIICPSYARTLYKFKPAPDCGDSSVVAIKDTDSNPKVIFMSVPIYYLDGNPLNTKALFKKIFIQEFGYN